VIAYGRDYTDEGGEPLPEGLAGRQPKIRSEGYSRTDDGNALRLTDAYGEVFRFCPERGRWLRWDGVRWAWDRAGEIRERARTIARELPSGDKPECAFRLRSLSAMSISNMVRLAATDAEIVVPLAELDADPWSLNTPSGVVDLRTGAVRRHSPDELVTKMTAFPLVEGDCPRFRAFLAETFGDDEELIAYVQRLLGYSLVGTVTEHVLPFAFGAGANGKSVLMQIAMTVLGVGDDGYSVSAPSDFLMARSNAQHPTEIARLKGARLVVCQEVNSGQRFDEAKVKQLTGGDLLAGRFMRQDFFTFTPSHHLWVVGNHRPEVRDGGPAFWRRVRLVPFDHVVPEERQDRHLAAKLLEAEGPEILGWLVAGAVAAVTTGIGEPQAVLTATTSYELAEDSVARFVAETCDVGEPEQPQNRIRVSTLRDRYEAWCREALVEPASAKAFTQRIRDHGVGEKRDGRARYYLGIRLRPEDDLEDAAADAGADVTGDR